ncbi:MAG: Rapamycin-insensitive companion of mTOR, N-term-domain-containing protein [Benniella sp.]|nr:MAG: Rapamycin-insensitive companion of mTOR, N-term-domain-containing protein [Benniella sp.]
MSHRRASFLMDSSTELASEVSPPIYPVADGPASWTTSQGDYGDGGLGALEDDGELQDSDDPDTTDNFDQEQYEIQDQDHDDDDDDFETKMDELYQRLQTETKAKESAESLLEIYRSKDIGNAGNNRLRNQVEQQLRASIDMIAQINHQLDYYKQRAFDLPSFAYLPDQALKESQQSIPVVTRRSHSNSFSTCGYADNEEDRQSIHSALADIVSSLRNMQEPPSARLEQLLNLANILKQNHHIHPGYPMEELAECLRLCLASTVREIRLNAYRGLRLLSGTGPLGPSLVAHKIDLFIVRSLMADQRIETERMEALKLVRCFVTTKEGMQYISDGVMRAVIAIAEQSDEELRNACLETLGEMIMSDPKPVARCGGFRVILAALTDNLHDLSDALLKVFLYMLESPETRIYVRQGMDSEMVMAVFSDIYAQGPSYTDRLRASGRIVTAMIRSWSGLFDLCANDKRAIRSLVQSIKLPIQENRKVLLDVLYDIFRIRTPQWLKDFLDGMSIKPTQEDLDSHWGSNLEPLGLVDHHQSVVLTVFIDAGLIEALIALTVDENLTKSKDIEDHRVLRKAMLLIPELMQLACKILPPEKSTHVQTLPSLFQVATNFEEPVLRHIATSAFRFIDTFSRSAKGVNSERLDDGRGQRSLDRIKQRMGTQLDDTNFRSLLNDTQVLATKDVWKWHWDLILEIIQGPMLQSRRLEEAIRNTKFTKRLLAFFRPLDHYYSDLPATESNQTYTKIGCALFETLANSVEGAKYLAQNKILRLIADGLAQLDPVQGHPGSDPIFSKERMETTMTSGYFEMLGALCKTRSGSRLLEKFKIFNLYYRLSELRSRDYIAMRIIATMDYSIDGHPRVILSKSMTSGYKHIRLYATQHLGTVIKNDKNEFNDWGIRLLCTQLCDTSQDVCHMAIRALDDACIQRKNLDLLIRLRPNLDHLGEAGNPLLLRFLSTSKGFQYLQDMSYIEGEMDDWYMFANRQYMIQMEVKLAKAMDIQRFNYFSEDGKFEKEAEEQLDRAKNILTPHFYGELTRTEEGCELLKRKGHFADYARYIREHCAESKDPAIISELKSLLWVVGNIGSTEGGLPFLEKEDLIKYIVGIAERSKVLSLKGTCFYVLGLMCKTTQGIEILEDYGWQGILHRDRTPRGLCLPKDLDRFLEVPQWEVYRENLPRVVIPLTTEGDAVEREVLKATGELGNHILTNGASKNLVKIKAEYPSYFSSMTLYNAVLDVLSHYHFRLPSRRFVLGLFDVRFEGDVWEYLDSLGAEAEAAVATAASPVSQDKFTFNVTGFTSFDSPSRSVITAEMLPSTPRSALAPAFAKGFSLSPSSSSTSLPLPTSSERPVQSRLTDEEQPDDTGDSEAHKEPPALVVNTETAAVSTRETVGSDSSDAQKSESDRLEQAVSPTLSISQPPPIPPPRPPPNAYEILYTNKPYHKNFAKEAGLAPLPPRVKVLVLEPEEDGDPMVMEARQSGYFGTSSGTVGRGSYSDI